MKNIIYLIFLSLLLITCSCDDDGSPLEDAKNNLIGTWGVSSIVLDGTQLMGTDIETSTIFFEEIEGTNNLSLQWFFSYTDGETDILNADCGISNDGKQVILFENEEIFETTWVIEHLDDGIFNYSFDDQGEMANVRCLKL